MKQGWASLAFMALFVSVISASETKDTTITSGSEVTDKTIVSARLETCANGLKRFHGARTFAAQDLPLYHMVEFKNVLGGYPYLQFLNGAGEVVELVETRDRSREELNQLLLKKGFYKKADRDEEVPEKYRNGPYVEREEL